MSAIKVGDMYMLQGTMRLTRVVRVTRRRVYYTDSNGFFFGSLPREDFEQHTIKITPHLRKRGRQQ